MSDKNPNSGSAAAAAAQRQSPGPRRQAQDRLTMCPSPDQEKLQADHESSLKKLSSTHRLSSNEIGSSLQQVLRCTPLIADLDRHQQLRVRGPEAAKITAKNERSFDHLFKRPEHGNRFVTSSRAHHCRVRFWTRHNLRLHSPGLSAQ
jgi:hypothetical protein